MAAEMRFLGVIFIAVQAMRATSFPVSSPTSEGDTKVMKCIVEVISDTLSKPSPLPIGQSCLETLRRDERIISILRHQNLLKELQELAAQGATERVQKKSGLFGDEPSGVLESQNNNKPEASDISEEITETPKTSSAESSSESRERKKQTGEEEEDREQEAPESSQEENIADELESNDIDKREPAAGDEDIDNHITDRINDQDLPAEDNTSDVHDSREKEAAAENKTESGETEETGDTEKADSKPDSEETETQTESMTPPEEHELEKDDTSLDGRDSKDSERLDGGNSHYHEHRSGEETSSAELDDSKRFNKMDELAKQLTSKKWAEENGSEEAGLGSKERKYDPGTQESDERRPWQRPRGDSAESESQAAKRPDPEEKKEEEGSANRKTEDQELESLAAIEAELEKVAHKLHELRRV